MSSAVPAHEIRPHAPAGARARRSLLISRYIYANWRTKLGSTFRDAVAGPPSGSGSLTGTLDEIDRAYRDYVYYGNLDANDTQGARILELGPVSTAGVALEFVAAGAAEIVLLDRFGEIGRSRDAFGVYRALRERARGRRKQNIDCAVSFGADPRLNPTRIQVVEGIAIEDAGLVLPPNVFSLILSRSVLGRTYDIDRAFAVMDRLLAPGGRMLHKIDLSDRGMFSNHGLHPLEFLTIPEFVYRLMAEYSQVPNRKRINYYRAKMRELGYFAGLLVSTAAGVEGEVIPHKPSIEFGIDYAERTVDLVRGIRPRLAREFRNLPDDDLIVTGLFLVAQKPG